MIRQALRAAAESIAALSDTPRLDAELLMAHALGVSRETMLLSQLDSVVPPDFERLLARRLRAEPIAYIIGRRAFWTIELEVGPGVLIPRADSETLIEAAVAHFGSAGPRTVLDLGTGSGALLLAALDEWPLATGFGVDASQAALGTARRNAERLGLAERATMVAGGWDGVGDRHDLILCNPPYIAAGETLPAEVAGFEPGSALFAGEDGLDDYRVIASVIGRQIAPGGIACIEIGLTQAAVVSALLAAEGLQVSVRQDLGGRDRCIIVHA